MTRIAIVTHGTAGDVVQYIRFGHELGRRGHEVLLLGPAPFASAAAGTSLTFASVNTEEEYHDQLVDTPILIGSDGPTVFPAYYRRHRLVDELQREVQTLVEFGGAGDTVLVGRHTSAMSVLIAGEMLGAPTAWVAMAPTQILTAPGALANMGALLREEIARLRMDAGLPPVRNWASWLNSAQAQIGLWPQWFDEAGIRAPSRVQLTGFVPADRLRGDGFPPVSLPAGLAALLDGPVPPVLVTGGTGRMLHQNFYEVAIEAARSVGHPILVVTQHRDMLPDTLPADVHWVPWVPFEAVFPRVAAALHHGGMGTCLRAAACRAPQLLLAHGFDRADNAERWAKHGLASWLSLEEWTPSRVATALAGVIAAGPPPAPPGVPLDRLDDTAAVADAIEALARPSGKQSRPSGKQSQPARPDGPAEGGMRILLAQNMRHLPSHGGANKSNRILMEELAARGHACTVVAPLSGALGRTTVDELVGYLAGIGVDDAAITDEAVRYTRHGVECYAVRDPSRLVPVLTDLASRVHPDWILVPSDDPGQLMLGAALRACPSRVVYLAYTLQQLPMGPRSFYPSATGSQLVRRAAGAVAISRAAQDYLRDHGGVESKLIYSTVYGAPPHPRNAARGDGFVTMVNPCAYKGISILLSLADALPDERFLAVPTWGTSPDDRAELARRANIELADPADDLAEVFARTAVLLMPSLWDETFGYTAVEAMLCGIPVLASEVGGLVEAKLGVPYQLPVRPITQYADAVTGEALPTPVIPEQDLDPWLDALGRLRGDPEHYADIAEYSRIAATEFVSSLDAGAIEEYLRGLRPAEAPRENDRLKALSPQRRAALARLHALRAAATRG